METAPTEAGGQRDPEPLHEQMAQLAHEIEDDDVAERLIHLAAQVRTLELAESSIDLSTRRCRHCGEAVQQFPQGWFTGAGEGYCAPGQPHEPGSN